MVKYKIERKGTKKGQKVNLLLGVLKPTRYVGAIFTMYKYLTFLNN